MARFICRWTGCSDRKERKGGKSSVCQLKQTDHVSGDNSNAELIRSVFLLSGRNEEHGAGVFSSLLLSIHLPFVTSNYIRRAADLWDTRRARRPNGWPRFNADPIVKHEEFRGTCASLGFGLVGTVPAAAARIFRIYVLSPLDIPVRTYLPSLFKWISCWISSTYSLPPLFFFFSPFI